MDDWINATVGLVGAICAVLGALVAWLAQREQAAVNNRLLKNQMEQAQKNWEQERAKLSAEREASRRQFEQSQKQVSSLSKQVHELSQTKEKYLAVRARLEKSF